MTRREQQIKASEIHRHIQRDYVLYTSPERFWLKLKSETVVTRTREAVRPCYAALEHMLGYELDDLGIPTLAQTLINTPMPEVIPLDPDTSGVHVHLCLILIGGITNWQRRELIAWRISRYTREEAAYWLGKCTQPDPALAKWAARGMVIALSGDGKRPEEVDRLLQIYSRE